MEIFNLNKGPLQPNGQRLESPHSVEPGWILLLPPGASGPGVHFGPLPTAAKTAARVARRHPPARHAAAATSPAAASAGYGSGTITETVIGGALLVFAVAGPGPGAAQAPPAGGGTGRAEQPSQAVRQEHPGRSRQRLGPQPGRGHPRPPAGAGARPSATRQPWQAGRPRPTGPLPAATAPAGLTPTTRAGQRATPGRRYPRAGRHDRLGAAVGYGRTTGSDSPDWPYPDHPSWPANSHGPAAHPGPPELAR